MYEGDSNTIHSYLSSFNCTLLSNAELMYAIHVSNVLIRNCQIHTACTWQLKKPA